MSQETYLPLVWRAIAPFRRRAGAVLTLVLADTAVTSVAVGMILPIIQSLMAPRESLAALARAVPFLQRYSMQTQMILMAIAIIAVFVLKAVMSVWSVASTRTFAETLRSYWITEIGRRYLMGRYASLQVQKQGLLLNTWFNETGVAARFFASYLAYISAAVMASAMVVLGLLVNWQAMLFFLVLGAVLLFLLRHRAFGAMTRLGQLKLRVHQGMSAAMAESLTHARELKILTAEPARLAQIDARARDLKSVLVRIGILAEMPRIIGESAVVIVLISLLLGGTVFMNVDPQKFLPVIAFFFVTIYRLMTTSMQAMTGRMKALSDLHSVRAVQAELDQVANTENREVGAPIQTLETDIRFERASFSYETGRTVVTDLDLVIPRGKSTFLIGPSGAGKSTLLDLLLRLQSPTAGCIVANGRDIAEFNLVQWRQLFGYVSQEAALFNGTIKMNLLLAQPAASEEEMREVCRLAGAHDFIQSFPQGYDTVVGDRGYSVSGGQRKRIAIARALITRPAVLILDEATTSFEQSLEREMLRQLRATMTQLTVIQVTHRLQSAVDADWVIAILAGRVVGSGSWTTVQSALGTQQVDNTISS